MIRHPTPCRAATARRLQRYAAAAALAVIACAPDGAWAQSLSVGAVVMSKSNCRFDIVNLVLDFSTIDATSTSNATASTGGTVTCNGGKASTVTLGLSLGNGTHSTGPGARRMRHTTELTEFLPYALSISPTSATIARNGTLAFTVDGAILPSQFQNVMAGNYIDTVTISVAP